MEFCRKQLVPLASRGTAMCNDELLLADAITMRWERERGTIRRPEIDRIGVR